MPDHITPETTPPDDTTEAERLAKHLAGRHADGMALQRSVAENREAHQDEHNGPGTIRNHDRDDLGYDERDVQQVIDELAEDESAPEPDDATEGLRDHRPVGDPGEPDEGPQCDADGEHWPCEAVRDHANSHGDSTAPVPGDLRAQLLTHLDAARALATALTTAPAGAHDLLQRTAAAIRDVECPHSAFPCPRCRAEAALSVRWEYAARQRVELERLRLAVRDVEEQRDELNERKLQAYSERDQAKRELASAWDQVHRDQHDAMALRQRAEQAEDRIRTITAEYGRLHAQADDATAARDRWMQRAEQAEAERDALRETLAETDLGAQVLAQWEAIAVADADRDRLETERDRYRLAWLSARRRAQRLRDADGAFAIMAAFAADKAQAVRRERDTLKAEVDDERAAKKTAADAADRFRDVLSEALGHPDENPGDDALVAELRRHFGLHGPEPTRWREFVAGALAGVDQLSAPETSVTVEEAADEA